MSRPISQENLRKWEKSARESTIICNQAAGFNRCLLKVQQNMGTQLKAIRVESKGKAPTKASAAVDELQFLLDFNASVCQSMAKAVEHLTEFVFVNMANATLLRRDSYMAYLKAGVKADTLNALRTSPLHLDTLFPDSCVKKAEEDITDFDRNKSGSVYKSRRYHPYERQDKGRTENKTSRPGRLCHALNVARTKGNNSTPHVLPRVSSSINDNHCFLQLRPLLLTRSPQETLNTLNAKFPVVNSAHTAPGHSQKKEISPGAAVCFPDLSSLKSVKGVSCVIALSHVNTVTNAPNVVTNLPVGGQTAKVLGKVVRAGGRSESCSNPEGGLHPSLPDQAKLIKNPNSCKLLWQSSQKSQTVRGITSAYGKKCYRTGTQTDLPRVLQPTIPGSQTQQPMEANPRFEQSKPLSQNREIQDGDSGNHQNLSPTRRVGNLHRLQGCIFPHSHTGTVKEIFEISRSGTDLSVQSSPFRTIHSSHGVHCHSKGGETYGHAEGYKTPPIPRRLVGESHIPPGLSPTYTGPSTTVQTFRLAGEHRKVGIGTQASFQLRRLPIRPPVRSGPTNTGQVAKPTGKDTITHLPTGLFSTGTDVLNRPANRDRETSSPRQTTHEAHSVASQKKLENTGISTQTDPSAQISASSLTMVAARRQRSHRPTTTPSTACSANLYRRIKRRVGRSLKRVYCQRNLVPTGKQIARKLLGAKSSLSGSKGVPKIMHRQNGAGCNRQYHCSSLYQQGRRHEVGPTLCPTLENFDLVHRRHDTFPAT